MANYIFGAVALTGGSAGALDSLDGTDLKQNDAAIVFTSSSTYIYTLDESYGGNENSPDIIVPDINAGNKRWVLVSNRASEASLNTSSFNGVLDINDDDVQKALNTIDDLFNNSDFIVTPGSVRITPIATNIGLGTITSTTIPLTSSTGTGATLPPSTTSLAGLMSAADKAKLDGITGSGGGGGFNWTIESVDKTTENLSGFFMDTSLSARTVALHSNPVIGDSIAIADYKGTFGTNNLTIAEALIHGVTQSLTLDIDNQVISMAYTDNTTGWKVINLEPNNVLIDGEVSSGRKNLIINGNFDIWQRATSQTANGYGSADRWVNNNSGTTKTASRQTFTLGQTDVPGNPRYWLRNVISSVVGVSNYSYALHKVESVLTGSGETVTLSFWAKADAAKNIALEFLQNFGSGGSPSITVTGISSQKVALTTSWTKYTVTITLPSITGKILGTDGNDCLWIRWWFDAGSTYNSQTDSLGQQSGTFDIAQVQLEIGDKATSFERRAVGEEEQLCFRFFRKQSHTISASNNDGHGNSIIVLSPRMRTIPSVTTTIPTGVIFSTAIKEHMIVYILYALGANSGATSCGYTNTAEAEL